MPITINLDHTLTDKYSEDEFLHRDAREKFLAAISKNLELLNSNLQDARVHNSILINGKRGYGKTSFILTMMDLLREEYEKDLFVLDIIDPTIVETKENIFILVLSLIQRKVEKSLKNPCSDVSQKNKRDFDESLKKLASGLSVLDGVGGSTLFKESVWNESELILEDALKNTKGGNDLEKNFKFFLEISLKILNKKVFLLVFDDIDTAANQGEMILELIRKYFTSPRLFVVLLGDIELFNLIVRNMQWKKLSPTHIKIYEENIIENLYTDEIDTLTQQYIIKILRSENIIALKRVYEVADSVEVLEYGKLKGYVENEIIKKLFKETNKTKITIFEEFLLKLPLRSIIQILQKNDVNSLKHTLFSDIKTKYTKNLSKTLESFQSLQNEKYYLLYKYISSFDTKDFDYTFLPQTDDYNKNSLNLLLNSHIAYGTKTVQDIFDYFIKFYMPLNFGTTYDNNTHSFKIARYFIKDLRKDNVALKLKNATVVISNDEFKKLQLSPEEQAIFNIFSVGLFTNSGLKNYFSFLNLFGFISNMFFYGSDINLNKLLQVKSFHFENMMEPSEEDQQRNQVQEAQYDTTNIRAVCIALTTKFKLLSDKALDINLSARQINSIWTRVQYAIKYIDDNPSARLSEQLQRYIQATLNAFIIVTLEDETEIRFNNALSLNSPIYKENLATLKKHDDKYLWLVNFVELGIWDILEEFSKKLDGIIITFDFNNEFANIEFEGALKDIKEAIIKNPKEIYKGDVTRIINSIRQRKSIDDKLSKRLIKELEKIKEKAKIKINTKEKDDNN